MNTINKYNQRVEIVNSVLCVGLDSNFERLPKRFKKKDLPQFEFNKWIIEQTHSYAAAYKPNIAFYEARGSQGIKELQMTMDYLSERYHEILTICDAKRADIGSSNNGYVTAIFDQLGFDAVTLQPYFGKKALKPFLDRKDKGCIILCRTSNQGAEEIQDLEIAGKTLWQIIAEKVCNDWNENNNCMLVVGATYPIELAEVRKIVGEMTLLVPGIGAQGGDIKKTVQAGLNKNKKGMIVNSSRGIIFANNPTQVAKTTRDKINHYR